MLRPDLILEGIMQNFSQGCQDYEKRFTTCQNEKRHKEKVGMPEEEKCKNSPTALVWCSTAQLPSGLLEIFKSLQEGLYGARKSFLWFDSQVRLFMAQVLWICQQKFHQFTIKAAKPGCPWATTDEEGHGKPQLVPVSILLSMSTPPLSPVTSEPREKLYNSYRNLSGHHSHHHFILQSLLRSLWVPH